MLCRKVSKYHNKNLSFWKQHLLLILIKLPLSAHSLIAGDNTSNILGGANNCILSRNEFLSIIPFGLIYKLIKYDFVLYALYYYF